MFVCPLCTHYTCSCVLCARTIHVRVSFVHALYMFVCPLCTHYTCSCVICARTIHVRVSFAHALYMFVCHLCTHYTCSCVICARTIHVRVSFAHALYTSVSANDVELCKFQPSVSKHLIRQLSRAPHSSTTSSVRDSTKATPGLPGFALS